MEEAQTLLTVSEYGIMSIVDSEGQPYGVPLNYVYINEAIYFHCALSGYKINNIKNNPKVSSCIVGDTKILPADFSSSFVSVVVFGVASEAMEEEWHDALLALVEKYSPDL